MLFVTLPAGALGLGLVPQYLSNLQECLMLRGVVLSVNDTACRGSRPGLVPQ